MAPRSRFPFSIELRFFGFAHFRAMHGLKNGVRIRRHDQPESDYAGRCAGAHVAHNTVGRCLNGVGPNQWFLLSRQR